VALQLIEQPLHVLLGLSANLLAPGGQRDVPDAQHHRARGALQLLARPPLLPQGVGKLVVLEGHGVSAPGTGLALVPVAVDHLVAVLAEVPGDLSPRRSAP